VIPENQYCEIRKDMAYLINRNPSGRLICLHALTSYLANRFSNGKFRLNDLKYDATCAHNIHQTCKLLVKLAGVNFPVCPYLSNPLSQAKCYLTQSIQRDKQKSKSASDARNALEGLGLINRDGDQCYITDDGLEFAKHDYFHPSTFKLIRQAVLRYGPFWSLLFLCKDHKDHQNIVKREDIRIGYPDTQEILVRNGYSVPLSTESEPDTITRTRSVLFAWGVTAGFLLPVGLKSPKDVSVWHIELLPFMKKKKWTIHNYKVFVEDNLVKSKPYVERPLGYHAMTKSTKALRERNQEEQRGVTLEFERTIKNRRFAISYLLAIASEQDSGVHFDKLVTELTSYETFFVIDKHNFAKVMKSELGIAFATGIPFRHKNRVLFPLTRLNISELSSGAPKELIDFLQKVSTNVIV
jgi:hypothetical protein